MRAVIQSPDALQKLFAALTEQTFQVGLGIADTRLTDYLTDVLMRFIRHDRLYRLRDTIGRRMGSVAQMLTEAGACEGPPQREMYKHIGDFTLFWTGVYPESLGTLQETQSPDALLDFCQQGKRSYYLASTFAEEPYRDEAPLLRRLSDEFELCTVGLQQVRREWEKSLSSPSDN